MFLRELRFASPSVHPTLEHLRCTGAAGGLCADFPEIFLCCLMALNRAGKFLFQRCEDHIIRHVALHGTEWPAGLGGLDGSDLAGHGITQYRTCLMGVCMPSHAYD